MKTVRLYSLVIILALSGDACKTQQVTSSIVGTWISSIRVTEWGRIQDTLVFTKDGRFDYGSRFIDGNSSINSVGNYSLSPVEARVSLIFDEAGVDSVDGRFDDGMHELVLDMEPEKYTFTRFDQ